MRRPVTGLTNGGNYTYYVRCQDASGNPNSDDFLITFSVAGTTTVTSNFSGTESPLSENGMWDAPGAWSDLSKNNGAYAVDVFDAARLVNAALSVPISIRRSPMIRIQARRVGWE